MIKDKSDYKYYLKADRIALGRFNKTNILQKILLPDNILKFQILLRKMEYYTNCKSGLYWKIIRLLTYRKFKKLSELLGFTIPINSFGPGLSIAHIGTIVVNESARIGANCRIHACVNIGTSAGYSGQAPTLGNNIYIGPGAKIYGKIDITDNIAIAANAVISKSVDQKSCVIAGVPAKIIKLDMDTRRILIPATELMELGVYETNGLNSEEIFNKYFA